MAEALYRKWRPGTLSELVGQNHVAQTLRQAVLTDRVSHAYMFCGPRGTGKTSTARILAKAVNCLSPSDGEPDDSCHMCLAVNEGRAIDLIEIDAASNRRIADIRDLTEKIHYSPAEAKFKVYIIDEVHMLTPEAFNALLKTLEEPPPHAILILATTDVHKVPLTIISRCQRFDFRRVPSQDIVEKLRKLSVEEAVEIEDEALMLVARKSTGSLRDAENILEQVIVSSEPPVTEQDVRQLLNLTDESLPADLLDLVADNHVKDSLVRLGQMIEDGKEPSQIHSSLIEIIRILILLKSNASDGSELGDALKDRLQSIAEKFSMERLIHIAKIISEVDFRDVLTPALPLEIAILESIMSQQNNQPPPNQFRETNTGSTSNKKSEEQILEGPFVNTEQKPKIAKLINEEQTKDTVSPPPVVPVTETNSKSKPSELGTNEVHLRTIATDDSIDEHWNELLRSLRQTGKRFNLGALLRGCKERKIKDDTLVLTFLHSSHLERINSEIEDPLVNGQFESVVENVLGKKYKISVELASNEVRSVRGPIGQQSYLVRAAQSLGARIVEERSKP
ncbi:MAG TPA: DNA polymerase III subunit gamma/tau [Dehalococcoidia bacterium]|nr:DNA polymerase III subunit gamma/tau [Dehalococcoidia bacterium]|tara:strand:+ start:1736 stop:3430 length:1695 start_codon:yes stop_codon:yes gene_type:complete